MGRKIIFLFLALALPVLFYLFLRTFGKNEFALPVYFEKGIDSVNAVCGTHFAEPYHVPDSVMERAGGHHQPATLFLFQGNIASDPELKKVAEKYQKELQVVSPVQFTPAILYRWATCVFMVPVSRNSVLVDNENRIRGYYALGSREEADRLTLELEILLKKY